MLHKPHIPRMYNLNYNDISFSYIGYGIVSDWPRINQIFADESGNIYYENKDLSKMDLDKYRNEQKDEIEAIIEDAKNDDGIDWGKVIPRFKQYTDFTIVNVQPLNMGNIDHLAQAREDAIGIGDTTRKIRFFLDDVNKLFNHKGLIPGTLTMISAAPGTGKTLTLVNQGIQATMDGYTNLHIFLGDLNKYDADLRYLSNYSKKNLNDILGMTLEEQQQLQQDLNNIGETKDTLSRNWLFPLPSGVYNVQQLCNEILNVQLKNNVHFDQIIVDYDANINSSVYTPINYYGKVIGKNINEMFTGLFFR